MHASLPSCTKPPEVIHSFASLLLITRRGMGGISGCRYSSNVPFFSAYKKKFDALQQQAYEKELALQKQLEEIKVAQMSEKEQEEYKRLKEVEEEAKKMNDVLNLVETLKQEKREQEMKIQAMETRAKNIAYIRAQLKEQPWMADVVHQLKIETEEDFRRAAVLSGQIKKWKELEALNKSQGSKNVFDEISGGQLSEDAKKATDATKASMDELLKTVIIK